MNPQVEAALIAGIVSLISLGGTVLVAMRGFQASKQAAENAASEAHRDTAETLAAQREQLDRTLEEQHVRTLNERFATAADKLGIDKPAAVRLAGVYAMAGLAGDWEDNRQSCIDVLCGYLRMPYPPDPGDGEVRLGFLADREVRHTVIRVIAAHLRDGAKASWRGRNFDFTGVVFDGGSFDGAEFSDGTCSFDDATFSGGEVSFRYTKFCGAQVGFRRAEFSGGRVIFRGAEFSGGKVSFRRAEFSGGQVSFPGARFSGGEVSFHRDTFSGGEVSFSGAEFSSSDISFRYARFSSGTVSFDGVRFSGGEVRFSGAAFSGARVGFDGADFSGGQIDFGQAADWSHPPLFTWDSTPPLGVNLPAQPSASPPNSTSGGAGSLPPAES